MRIGCGCVNLGSGSAPGSLRDQVSVVQRAVDAGVTVFDTADVYSSGFSERVLGRALRGRRDRVTVSTKGGYLFRERSSYERYARRAAAKVVDRIRATARDAGAGGPSSGSAYGAQDFSAAHLRRSLDASLRRLGTDHVDVYHLHGPREVLDGLFDELDDLRRAGKVRRFGIGAESVASANAWVPIEGVDVLQLPVGVLDPHSVPVVRAAAARGIEVWARGVLGGGILSAAMREPDTVGDHSKRRTVDALLDVASAAGIGLDEVAIRWLVGQDGIDTMLVGASRFEHVDRNVRLAALGALPSDVARAVDAVLADPTTSPVSR